MEKNRYADIADLLEIKFNTPFKVWGSEETLIITEDGVCYYNENQKPDYDSVLLHQLLIGKLVPKKPKSDKLEIFYSPITGKSEIGYDVNHIICTVNDIETAEVIRVGIERQIKKRLNYSTVNIDDLYSVPTCSCPTCHEDITDTLYRYCSNCGQKLDWSE